jgi:uncharacterized OB-fold protein
MTANSTLLNAARAYVGKPARAPRVARDAVNLPMIRRWCEAMGETNPIHVDAAAAQRQGHPGIVAPPAMLDVWATPPYRAGGSSADDGMAVLDLFDAAGYTGVVATNLDHEYERYLVEGDIVHVTMIVDDVSEEKRTALGFGHFVTMRYEFTDQRGTAVGRMLFRLLKFKPKLAPATAPAEADASAAPHPRPAITHDNAFFWDGLNRRELLIQSCNGCGRLRHPPGPMCPHCHSLDWTAIAANRGGKIHSFVVIHHPKMPGFDYPLAVILVELDEGVRIVANLIDAAASEIAIGQSVSCEFREVEPGYTLPVFRRT